MELSGFEVYPNPSSHRITIHNQQDIKNFSAFLKDQNGKIILKKFFSETNSDFVLDFSEQISNGIYYLELVVGEKKFVKKVVIIK